MTFIIFLNNYHLDIQVKIIYSKKKISEYFWGFYGHRLEMYRKVDPHKGFHILKKFS